MSVFDNYECEGQMTIFDVFPRDTLSTKMSQGPSVQTKERTSDVSLKKLRKLQTKTPLFLDLRKDRSGHTQDLYWVTDIRLLGAYMTSNTLDVLNAGEDYVYLVTLTGTQPGRCYLNCSEKPLVEKPSKLSQILELTPDPKYNLSPRACQGILNRAERRGKKLPQLLKETLEVQSHSKNEQADQGGAKDY